MTMLGTVCFWLYQEMKSCGKVTSQSVQKSAKPRLGCKKVAENSLS